MNEVAPNSTADNVIALDLPGNQSARPATAEGNKNDAETFKFQGKTYRLFKRTEGRDASYNVRTQVGSKRFKKCLETNIKAVAIERAKEWLDKILGGKWDDVEKLKARQTVAKFGQILDLYLGDEESPGLHRISPDSARNNAWAFGKVLKSALKIEDVREVSLMNVNKALIDDFQTAEVNRYLANAAKDATSQRTAREQALRSSRSVMHQARSLFNRERELVQKYERAGLKIPNCVEGFMSGKLDGEDRKREYLPPPDDVVQRAFVEIEKLRETEPTTYVAFWAAVGAGLRRGEILRTRWEHFITRDGEKWVSGGLGKNGHAIEVPVQTEAWAKLEPFCKAANGAGLILGEAATLEYARKINWWMTQQGWKTEKKIHELRAYVGSMIYVVNPVAAMKFMRHNSIKVTEQFYARYGKVKTPQVLDWLTKRTN